MKIIFVGGVQGVGKSTLLSWAKRRFGRKVVVLDPGAFFRKYFYSKKIKTIEEIEDLIVAKIKKSPTSRVTLVHWHYAVKRSSGYIPQVSVSRLNQIAQCKYIQKIILLMIQAPAPMIYARRMKDINKKKRGLTYAEIEKEIAMDEIFMKRQVQLFARSMRRGRLERSYISNSNLKVSMRDFAGLIKGLL